MNNKGKSIISKWIKSQGAKTSGILFLISIVLLFMASPLVKVDWNDEAIAFVNNGLIGLAVGLLGIIITISFVQSALDKQTIKNERIDEYKKIARYSKYLQILIDEYVVYYNILVTPIDKSVIGFDKGFIKNFALNDLRGMYLNSRLIRDGFNTSAIKKFYEVEENLSSYLLRWNEEIDFKYATKLEEIINEFLAKSKQLDSRDNILGARNTVSGDKRLSEIITDELNNDQADYLKKFSEGQLQSNIMTSVVMLYYFLNMQQDCITRLINEIEVVKQELKDISE